MSLLVWFRELGMGMDSDAPGVLGNFENMILMRWEYKKKKREGSGNFIII